MIEQRITIGELAQQSAERIKTNRTFNQMVGEELLKTRVAGALLTGNFLVDKDAVLEVISYDPDTEWLSSFHGPMGNGKFAKVAAPQLTRLGMRTYGATALLYEGFAGYGAGHLGLHADMLNTTSLTTSILQFNKAVEAGREVIVFSGSD